MFRQGQPRFASMDAICGHLLKAALMAALLCCTISGYCASVPPGVACRTTTITGDLGPRRCWGARMSEADRRLRPRSLVAPLTLVTAVTLLTSIAAATRLAAHDPSAPSNARVVVSDTVVVHHNPKPVPNAPVVTAPAAPADAVFEPKAIPRHHRGRMLFRYFSSHV